MKTVCYIIPKSAERSYTCTHRLNYYLHGELKVRTSCLVLFPISVQFYSFYIFQNMYSSFVPKLLTVVGGCSLYDVSHQSPGKGQGHSWPAGCLLQCRGCAFDMLYRHGRDLGDHVRSMLKHYAHRNI
jgi:hypothetical protein